MPNIVQNYNETTNDPEYPLTYEEAILDPDGNPIKGYVKETVVAPQYDPTTGTYAVGDPVMNDKKYYRCNTAVSTPEDFDTTKWTEKTISEEIDGLNQNLAELDSYVKGNTLNTLVKITSYTSSNPYTCPKDGFIMVVSASTLGSLTSVFNPINQYVPFARTEPVRAGYPQTISIFVKKGMQFYVSKSTGTDGEVYFCGID